jgi:ribosomal protein S18 acetylase RimI-like enzyme
VSTPANDRFAVRRMERGEIGLICEWATAEGWNPGRHDGAAFFAADPNGYFLGTLAGEPVACVSCVAYDDAFGFLGQYIVRPEYRGRGYGLEVWRAGMAYLGDRNTGLDGVVAQQENYRRSGFHFAHNHIRYRGIGGGTASADTVPLADVPFDELLAFDLRHFPAARPEFLKRWIALSGATALGFLRQGKLAGIGVIRPAIEGFKIGPLFAEAPEIADALLKNLAATAPGQPFVLDIPDDSANPAAADFARRHGLTGLFRTARMYTRPAPAIALDRIYGATSLELG